MPMVSYGVPGGSLADDGTAKYGSSARVGAWFERQVAAALDRWLASRPEKVHVFHDLQGLDTVNAGRRLALGTSNIDHVLLTGAGWIMIDAKRVSRGRLAVHDGHGVLITPDGQHRPQPWMDDKRAYSRTGSIYDLTGNMTGVRAWVVPNEVDYSALARQAPRCVERGDCFLTLAELAAGELESVRELRPPYREAKPAHIEQLSRHVSQPGSAGR